MIPGQPRMLFAFQARSGAILLFLSLSVLFRTLFYHCFKMAFTEKRTAIIVISVLFPLTAVLLVGLRLRVRVLTSERIKADDYWIVTAVVNFGCRATFEKSHY